MAMPDCDVTVTLTRGDALHLRATLVIAHSNIMNTEFVNEAQMLRRILGQLQRGLDASFAEDQAREDAYQAAKNRYWPA